MNALSIAWLDLKRLMRERTALGWIFIGPVVFTIFFGMLFKPQPERQTTVAIVNHDVDDRVARAVGVLLEQDRVKVVQAQAIEAGRWSVEIPRDAAALFAAAKPMRLTLHAREEESTEERNVRFKVQKALTLLYLHGDADLSAESIAALPARLARAEIVALKPGDIGVQHRPMTAGFQRSVPSYLVMFVFLNVLVSGATIAADRATGRMRRLFIAPIRKRDIVLGKLLSRFAIGWIQIAYMLALGVLLFGIRWAQHGWVFFGFLTIFALASAALGLLVGTLFDDPDTAASAAVWTSILLAPLGGLWWPLEVVGPTMRTIGNLVPTGWAMQGVNAMLAFDAGAAEVAPFALALAVLLLVALTLATRRLRPA
ncbi:MAG TPA: ABC transporter permease [Vicinamibacterales bacterium]|jgi:ABC-2 type transport system permease protein|nr:ABC transporter permease [Vicinamibacterales bacterium]